MFEKIKQNKLLLMKMMRNNPLKLFFWEVDWQNAANSKFLEKNNQQEFINHFG